MRIAEISSPDIRQPDQIQRQHLHLLQSNNHNQQILSQIESLIKHAEALSSSSNNRTEETAAATTTTTTTTATLPLDLRKALTLLSQLLPFPNSLKLQIWKLSYRLWNACVDIANAASVILPSSSSPSSSQLHAKLRHVAADMLSLALDVSGVPSPAIKSASFYHKTGFVWHDLGNLDLASACFEKATDILSKIDMAKMSDNGERRLLLNLNLARSRTAWEVQDRNLALTLLGRSKSLLFGLSDHYKLLASQYLAFGKSVLSNNESCAFSDALKLMNEALDICEKGSGVARAQEQEAELKGLRSKTLRFISAVHLQKGEYESVIKCVRVLREGGDDGDHHASLPVLAMKAWLGLGRYGEAEKELRGMVANKGIPEGVWVSAVEAFFEAAGTAWAETIKGLFLGLLGRCHVSARAAVRVARRVVGDGDGGWEGSKVRAKVVAELVSDERVVALFQGQEAATERKAMHAVLWNCASDHFRSKDYTISAEMFEKSMFYIPHDLENKILRAKGFRVLGLCYLGLSQLDQAKEYINEAEKIEPNIACAFLKFKISLQENNHTGAVDKIQAMKACLDFTPDFLALSAHEAVACHALPVATASLSNLLHFYASGKSMPVAEVVVLRTLITILTQGPEKELEILKYIKQAHARASERGTECFFGKGEVGRREQNWFAVTSWNFGIKCGKEKNFDLCAEFLRLVPEFYDGLIDGTVEENKIKVCKSLILTVSAMIASENEKKTALLDSEVKQALDLLGRAAKMLTSISMKSGLGDDELTAIEPDIFFMYTVNACDIHGRLDTSGPQEQLSIVKSFASSKACNPKYLLQIGLIASRGPCSNPEVATFALNECLSAVLSSPSPDYEEVALIVRRLIALASIHKGDTDDDIVHNMYKQAYRIMIGLKEGEYPVEEGKWLAMTAWNRAALPARLGQFDAAKKWMNVGLELARKVTGMDTYRSCMDDFLAAFERKIQLQNKD